MKYNEKNLKNLWIKKIDLLQLREKGMTRNKLSKIIGVPVDIIERQLEHEKKYKKYSGIF